MKKLLIVANRLPVRCESGSGGITVHSSEGGLATGLSSLNSQYEKEWVGWPGIYVNNSHQENEVLEKLEASYHPVFLSETEVNNYYEGFSNETLWPLFHYFMEGTRYSNENWESYKQVNQKFCDKIIEVVEDGDIIWVQDYHLMLLPMMLRERLGKRNPIGFFLHIPFPSFELFRTLPWRRELIDGLMGADLVGFHTPEYLQHFTNTMSQITGYEHTASTITVNGRKVKLDSFPMGINFDKFNEASECPVVTDQLESFKARFGGTKVVLSVDRLDYTKGIINRLRSFDVLLTKYPHLKEKVSLLMLAVPSRDKVGKYRDLKIEVDEMVGYINGKYATMTWTPVNYFYRSIPFEQLVALYNLADICMVTPLRDGMNLVAKEYVASKTHGNGVLVLSEMAGAALELEGSVIVNPNDEDEVADALFTAIHMDEKEQEVRMEKMKNRVKTHNVKKWGTDFIRQLETLYQPAVEKNSGKVITRKEMETIRQQFETAGNSLIVLDYDGTLVPFFDHPADARPDNELKELLRQLNEKSTVVLLSGRNYQTMEEWFGNDGMEVVAEHGIWYKRKGEWKSETDLKTDWKPSISEVLEDFAAKTPGAFIEEKSFSLVFHYRRTNSWLQEIRVPELLASLRPLCDALNLDIMEGNKVIEIRIPGIDKGFAAGKWVFKQHWDFIMAIGDDRTDEDMFRIMPEEAYTIKVGSQETRAALRADNFMKVRELLKSLVEKQAEVNHTGNLKLVYKKAV